MLWLQVSLKKRWKKKKKMKNNDDRRCRAMWASDYTRTISVVCLAADQISKVGEHENLLSLTFISLCCVEELIRPPRWKKRQEMWWVGNEELMSLGCLTCFCCVYCIMNCVEYLVRIIIYILISHLERVKCKIVGQLYPEAMARTVQDNWLFTSKSSFCCWNWLKNVQKKWLKSNLTERYRQKETKRNTNLIIFVLFNSVFLNWKTMRNVFSHV